MSKTVSVWAHIKSQHVLVGRLGFDEHQYTFIYADSYLNKSDAQSLDPINLKLSQKEHSSASLFGVMRDALPDSWGRYLIAKRLNADPERISEIDFMIHSSNNRVGALEFTEFFGEDLKPDIEKILRLNDLKAGISDLNDGKHFKKETSILFQYGSSMGGARPKAAIIDAQGNQYLAKFNKANDMVNMARCEHAAMSFAKILGVNVAETHVQQVAGIDVLMVKRFDRENGNKKLFVSALSLTSRSEMDFMNSSYVELNDLTHSISKNSFQTEWFKRMLFNVLCNNDDDHLRNHGFYYHDAQWQPTPAYDIMPRAILGEVYRLAIGLEHGNRDANVSNVLQAGQSMAVPNLESVMENMILDFSRKWKSHFVGLGVSQEDIDVFEKTFSRIKVSRGG